MAQIIPKNHQQVEPHWQKELANGFTDPISLLKELDIDPAPFSQDAQARRLFPMRVPRAFVNKMEKGNVHDPLLRQILPLKEEFIVAPEFELDPLQEHNTANKGLLHKYSSRVLLIVKSGCAVNCRYCFRRHFPYKENAVRQREWLENIEYISQRPDIDEVILSGGDPLMAKDDFLSWLCESVSNIEHVKRIRIHTRLPVVLPNRISQGFCDWLTRINTQKVIVLHINHPNEIDKNLIEKCAMLKASGITLFNQAVLLRGVNDCAELQISLNDALFEAGIQPYYLHLLDKVQGTQHFFVDDDKAKQIMRQVIERQAGFLVPKLVREIGGQPSKTPVDLLLHP